MKTHWLFISIPTLTFVIGIAGCAQVTNEQFEALSKRIESLEGEDGHPGDGAAPNGGSPNATDRDEWVVSSDAIDSVEQRVAQLEMRVSEVEAADVASAKNLQDLKDTVAANNTGVTEQLSAWSQTLTDLQTAAREQTEAMAALRDSLLAEKKDSGEVEIAAKPTADEPPEPVAEHADQSGSGETTAENEDPMPTDPETAIDPPALVAVNGVREIETSAKPATNPGDEAEVDDAWYALRPLQLTEVAENVVEAARKYETVRRQWGEHTAASDELAQSGFQLAASWAELSRLNGDLSDAAFRRNQAVAFARTRAELLKGLLDAGVATPNHLAPATLAEAHGAALVDLQNAESALEQAKSEANEQGDSVELDEWENMPVLDTTGLTDVTTVAKPVRPVPTPPFPG